MAKQLIIVVIPFDRNKSGITWSKDEQSLYFTAQSNGGSPLYKADIKTKQVKQLSDYDGGISSFDIYNDMVVYSKTQVSNPSELYGNTISMQNEKRLTAFNYDWLQKKEVEFSGEIFFC